MPKKSKLKRIRKLILESSDSFESPKAVKISKISTAPSTVRITEIDLNKTISGKSHGNESGKQSVAPNQENPTLSETTTSNPTEFQLNPSPSEPHDSPHSSFNSFHLNYDENHDSPTYHHNPQTLTHPAEMPAVDLAKEEIDVPDRDPCPYAIKPPAHCCTPKFALFILAVSGLCFIIIRIHAYHWFF